MGELAAAGVATRAAAEVLNTEGLRTRRGGLWSSPMVARYLRTGVSGVPGVTRRLSK
jgi:hypothetical protein